MIFDSNTKLLIILFIIIGLIYVLNKNDNDVIPNEGELELDATQSNVDDKTIDEVINDVSVKPVVSSITDVPINDKWSNQFNNDLAKSGPSSKTPVPVDNGSSLANFDTSIASQDISNIVNDGKVGQLIKENEDNKLKFMATDLLPKEVNKDWFETDFTQNKGELKNDNLIMTDRYVIGVNTVGQSLKVPSYDLRPAPPCPKITVSPWNQSTAEPDYNIKAL
jgi:hypothetical protein